MYINKLKLHKNMCLTTSYVTLLSYVTLYIIPLALGSRTKKNCLSTESVKKIAIYKNTKQ